MLALLCLGMVAADLPPYAIHAVAVRDLREVKPEARPWTRYLSLHGIPEAERGSFRVALDLALNGVSIRGDLYRPKTVGRGLLVRLDLRSLGWDRFNREVELDKLTKLGVNLQFKSDRDKQFYIDIWEFMGFFEPYFVASEPHRRGWLNPALVDGAEKWTHTRKLVIAAHWLFPRLLLERDNGGFYSQLLIHPPTLADLEKRYGVFRAFIDLDIRAKHGAAVVKSFVSYNPREIQYLAGGTGDDLSYFSITNDYLKSDRAEKDPRETPAGRSKPDAHEVLFPTANGLQAGYLANGQGVQAAFAPQQVAEDQRLAVEGRYYCPTKTVFTYAKCMDCHWENRGQIGFQDRVIKLINPPRRDTGYLVVDYDPKAAARETRLIEEFYREGLPRKQDLYRDSLEAKVKELTGQDCLAASRNLLKWYDRLTPVYAAEPVTPEIAQREMGYPAIGARAMWKAASVQGQGKPFQALKNYNATVIYQALAPVREGSPVVGYSLFGKYPVVDGTDPLGFLAAGEPLTRIRFEQVVGDALAQDVFAWDRIPVPPRAR